MKTINYIIILLIGITKTSAQSNFQGEVKYIAQHKQSVKIDSSQLSSNQNKNTLLLALNEKFNSGIKETYILKFDKVSSLYKKEEKLEVTNPNGIRFSADIGFRGDKLYKNIKENRYTIENEFYGKRFLIKDNLQEYNWILKNEIKKIGDYTCYKAIKKIKKQVIDKSFISLSLNENKSKEVKKTKEIEIVVMAWYTPQIPVSFGPGIYHGLPGLILEVTNDTETILCNKIILNTKNKIKEPKKGKIISPLEFNKIVKEKQREEKEFN